MRFVNLMFISPQSPQRWSPLRKYCIPVHFSCTQGLKKQPMFPALLQPLPRIDRKEHRLAVPGRQKKKKIIIIIIISYAIMISF